MPIYDKNATKEAKEYLDTLKKIQEEEKTLDSAAAKKRLEAAYTKLADKTRVVVDNIQTMAKAEGDAVDNANKLGKTFDILRDSSSKISDVLGALPNSIKKAGRAGQTDLAKSLGSVLSISEKLLETGGDYTEINKKQAKQIIAQLNVMEDLVGKGGEFLDLTEKQQDELMSYIKKLKGVTEGFESARKQAQMLGKVSKATGGALDPLMEVLNDFKDKKFDAGLAAVFAAAFGQIAKLAEENIKNAQKLGTGIVEGVIGTRDNILSLRDIGTSFFGVRENILEARAASQILAGSLRAGSSEAAAINRAVVGIETGLGADSIAGIEETFVNVAGLSREAAGEALNGAIAFAKANDVAPTAVLQDMAGNAEALAKFSDGTAMGMAKAAVQAQRLGINLGTAAGIARGLLDIESSLTAEFEASVLLGKNFNFDRARALALNNDLVGAVAEVTRQLGGQQEFANMNVLQREAIAGALGIGVDQLASVMAKRDRATLDTNTFQKKNLANSKELIQLGILTNGILTKIMIGLASLAGAFIGGRYLKPLFDRVRGGFSGFGGTGGAGMRGLPGSSRSSMRGLDPGKALKADFDIIKSNTNALKSSQQLALPASTGLVAKNTVENSVNLAKNSDIILKNTNAMTKFTRVLSMTKNVPGLKSTAAFGAIATAADVALADADKKGAALGIGLAETALTGVATAAATLLLAKPAAILGASIAAGMGISYLGNKVRGMFGDGGPVQRSGSYLVGEYGPEIVELKRGSMVHSNADIKGAMAEGAGSGLADIGPLIAEIRGLKEQMRMVVNNTGDTAKV